MTPEQQKLLDDLCSFLKEQSKRFIMDHDPVTMERFKRHCYAELDICLERLKKKYPISYTIKVNSSDKDKLDVTITLPENLYAEGVLDVYDEETPK